MWMDPLLFVKVTLFDPRDILVLANILDVSIILPVCERFYLFIFDAVVMKWLLLLLPLLQDAPLAGIQMQSYESHIPYLLQFTSTFNVSPMGWIHLSQVKVLLGFSVVFSPVQWPPTRCLVPLAAICICSFVLPYHQCWNLLPLLLLPLMRQQKKSLSTSKEDFSKVNRQQHRHQVAWSVIHRSISHPNRKVGKTLNGRRRRHCCMPAAAARCMTGWPYNHHKNSTFWMHRTWKAISCGPPRKRSNPPRPIITAIDTAITMLLPLIQQLQLQQQQ